jgi:hypothetical protein
MRPEWHVICGSHLAIGDPLNSIQVSRLGMVPSRIVPHSRYTAESTPIIHQRSLTCVGADLVSARKATLSDGR